MVHGVALNLSKYRSIFPPSVISDSNIASKLGAGNAGGGFFRVKSLGMTGWKVMCSRDLWVVYNDL